MRHALAALVLALAVCGATAGPASAQRPVETTVGAVLAGCDCLLPRMPPDLLDTAIADHAVMTDAGTFLIAFRLWSERDGFPEPPIRLIAGDRRRGTWTRLDVAVDTRRDGTGPITDITRSQGLLLIERRIAIDGASTTFLSPDLRRVGGAYHGFSVTVLPNRMVVYQRAQPHVSPTHYVEMVVLDTRTGMEKVVYPPTPQAPVRRQFVEAVRRRWDARGADWLQQADHHNDAERFASNGGNVVVNWTSRALAFTVSYEDEDLRRVEPPRDIIEQHVMVTCDGLGAAVTTNCRETPLEQWQALHPGASEETLVAAAAASPRKAQ